jgi:rubrerythrin
MSPWSDKQVPDAMWSCCFGHDAENGKSAEENAPDMHVKPCKKDEEPDKDDKKPCPVGMCANYREQLEESILDELCDAGFYAEIANEAPTQILRELIISIVGDEYGHARLQASLLGICPPPISAPADCPPATGNFEADVQTAIRGELGAISRYATLASCAPTYKIRYLLTSILGDEYAHARIWTAMLQAECLCGKKKG